MAVQSTCPGPDELRRLLSGELLEADAVELEEHVGGCTRCLERVRTLSPQDTLLDAAHGDSVAEILDEPVDAGLLAHSPPRPRASGADGA